MASYDLEEQEQLASLKAWWKKSGGIIVAIVAFAAFILLAWNAWTWYQRSQAANAAIIYEKLQKAVRANDIKTTRNVAGEILEQYPRTTYAPFAAMLSAKVHFESGDLKTARAQLQWAETKSRSDGLKAIARLRLAGVLIDDNAASDAERLLVEKPEPGFEALYSAMRGDALLAQHKGDEAKTAYKAALDAGNGLEPSMRDLVKMKLGALGEY